MSRLDFGTEDLFLYRSRGFRWNESDGRETWNWTVAPHAEVTLPLDIDGHGRILLRAASAVGNILRVRVNGVDVGAVELRGGFVWRDAAVYVPGRAWKPGLYQDIAFEAQVADAGRYVAIAEVAFEPVESVADIDFGGVALGHYRAEGFREAEGRAGVTWTWAEVPDASLEVPLETPGDRRMLLRLMSAVDNEVRISVNGTQVGRARVPGDFVWQETAVYVPEKLWRAGPAQHVRFETAHDADGCYFALDRLTIAPISAIETVDFGRANLPLYQAEGFGEDATDGDAGWAWIDRPSATLELPLRGVAGGQELQLRLMAVNDTPVRVVVNGVEVGRLALFGGFTWQDAAVPVPESAWRPGPTQVVRFESVDPGRNLRVGIDRLALAELRLVEGLDFGSESLALYQATGFRQNEAHDGTTWNWVTEPEAALRLPLGFTEGDRRMLLHLMSPVDNTLRVTINATPVGEVRVPGGFVWHEAAVYVPRSAWVQSPVQEVRFVAGRRTGGVYVALDRLSLERIPHVEVIDFGSDNLGLYSARGLRAHETGEDGTTWNWMDSDAAEFELPVWVDGPFSLRLKLMSAVDNALSVSVNGTHVGEREIDGGFRWQEVVYYVPLAARRDTPAQVVRLEAAHETDGLRVAMDRITVWPIPDAIDLGSGAVERFRGTGFRWDESNGRESWNWTVEPVAEIAVPVDTTYSECIGIRLAVPDGAGLRVAVNGTYLDDGTLTGSPWWQWFNAQVPESAWVPGVMQTIRMEGVDADGPLYLAVDCILFGPSRVYNRFPGPMPPRVCP